MFFLFSLYVMCPLFSDFLVYVYLGILPISFLIRCVYGFLSFKLACLVCYVVVVWVDGLFSSLYV
ncbi:hypothetical protein Lalb_Chr22g0358101 [Lupinus albus]|uniref:Uncharacterized protein n=1 Tax=Lupinus albus TaxID=3870 RepID=A0A6A4NQ35_LUPAL|nr:hypothetical protein Lalb_Chr22g0358101 [Lupinus albus]